jgi:DNA-binding NtrC family response regulator
MIDVLIFDDDLDIGSSLKTSLNYIGLKVECVLSQEKALAMVKNENFQFRLAIIDLQFDKGAQGTDLIREIHLRRPDTILIGISGCVDDELEAKTLQAGAKEVWEKPIRLGQFESKILSLLGKSDKNKQPSIDGQIG